MISRLLKSNLLEHIADNKALIIFGPRQCGKTTLINDLMNDLQDPRQYWNGDDFTVRASLENASIASLKRLTAGLRYLFIDEAQRIENIGLCIKMMVDNIPDLKVIATVSSAFELSNRLTEPMTGRRWEYLLLPLSFKEMVLYHSLMTENSLLDHRLIYGYYPEVVTNPENEIQLLKQLADSYLYKDILMWERILKPEKLEKLVQALAFQIGNEVSYHELGQITGLDNQTVERYTGLVEKAFIVFRLSSLSRNLRNELKKSRKIYFYDNGLRNAVINAFNPLNLRNDAGALWENFMVSERYKYITTHNYYCNRFFWRTTAQQEVDYIEEKDGRLYAFEFKWGQTSRKKVPKTFSDAYPGSKVKIITQENFTEVLGVDV